MNIIKTGFLSLVLAASCGAAWAKEIRIATLAHDTPQVNAAIMVMSEIYKRIGYDMTIVRFPGKRSLVEANLGTTEGELMRIEAIEKSYPNLVRVPYVIGRLIAVALVRKGQPKISEISALRGKRVGILRGVEYTEIVTKNMDRQILNSVDGLFNSLLRGRVDVVLFPALDVQAFVNSHGLENEVHIGDPIVDFPLYHYLHKDSQIIADELAEEMQRMTKNGELNKLLKRAEQALH